MTIETIREIVARLRKRYGYAGAEEICEAIGIRIRYFPMGKAPSACKGFYTRTNRIRNACINSDLPEEHQRIILPHELGHGVLHDDLAKILPFQDFELFDATSHCEYEANLFAADFLLNDDDVLDMLNEDMSFFQAAAALSVPPELLDFKFRVLKRMGYALNAPICSNSNFMKNIDRSDRF